MRDMFHRVSGLRTGYAPDEVDAFFARARAEYESAAVGGMTGEDVRRTAFELVRGGYQTAAVDEALDRLEAAFVARVRADFVARYGQQAWMDRLAEQARTLYPRLTRPDGARFAPPVGRSQGYAAAEVDQICHRLTAFFDSGTPLPSSKVRNKLFRSARGRKAYAEGPVDAFMHRAVEVLLGVE